MNFLFQPEINFLDKIRENMAHDLKIKDAIVCIFKTDQKDGTGECQEIYYGGMDNSRGREEIFKQYRIAARTYGYVLSGKKNGPQRVEKLPPKAVVLSQAIPHMVALIEPLGEKGMIVVDICGFGNGDITGFANLSRALVQALVLFRGKTSAIAISQCVGKDVASVMPAQDIITEAVAQWLKDDKEYQAWAEKSSKYINGYFAEPDFSILGHDLVISIRDAIRKEAIKLGDMGSFVVSITPHYKLMDEMFGGYGDEDVPTPITLLFRVDKRELVVAEDNLYKIEVFYGLKTAEYTSIVNFAITFAMNSDPKKERSRKERYKKVLKEAVLPYLEVWRGFALTNNVKCQLTEKEN